jgi:glucans biosynthesis protein
MLGLVLVCGQAVWGDDAVAPAADGFSIETVIAEARALAEQPYDGKPPVLPAALETMTYDQFRRIQHRRDKAVWGDQPSPFRLMFFHRGWLHKQQVVISQVDGDRAEVVPYHSEWFEYHDPTMGPLPGNLGFAGLKLLHELNEPGKWDEVVSFLGASYFRPLAKGQHYGLSVRGLAIDTGLPSGEEFPSFKKYWVVTPDKDATTFTMFALLDSPSISGAYRYDFTPGEQTVIEVDSHLFPRKAIQKLGIAPLTSMYLYGEAEGRPPYDFRPEVHDSDGLLIADRNGEWLWRPLANPKQTRTTQSLSRSLRGFGLMQRDREYLHYEDLESEYHIRPSLWVEPLEGFGSGRVSLLEIASDDEGMDNIVAQFVADAPVEAGQRLHYRYRLHVMNHDPVEHTGGKAKATRRMWRPEGFPHDTINVPDGAMRYLIDFHGGPLESLDPVEVEEAETMKVVASATNATIQSKVVHYNRMTGTWRAFFDVTPVDRNQAVEIRAFLQNGPDVLTETWSYSWNP